MGVNAMASSIVLGIPFAGAALILVASVGEKIIAAEKPALTQIESADKPASHCASGELDFLKQFLAAPTSPASNCNLRENW